MSLATVGRAFLVALAGIVLANGYAPSAGAQGQTPRQAPQQGARPSPAAANADAPKSPAAPQGAFELYEWVVFVADPNQSAANAERLFQSTLPEFVGARRQTAPAAEANAPSPVGVIRVRGEVEGDKLDVLLQAPGGRFLGQWPKGKGRSNRQLWEGYTITSEAPPGLKELAPGHWFGALREVQSPFLRRDRAGERFLAYDVELNYTVPLHVTGGKDLAYELANSGAAPLHDVTVYKPQESGWRTGTVPSMPAAKGVAPATGPATRPTTGPADDVPPGMPAEAAARVRAARAAAAARAGVRPGTQPGGAQPPAPVAPAKPVPGAAKASVTADAPAAGAESVLSPWKERLAKEGFAEGDVATVLRILERHALDKKRLTLVYRLDAAELDRMLPLEVTPTPRKTVRVGLVIARNLDPAVGDEVDQLIKQLASADWEQRELASKQLAELGPAARPKLQAALQQKDLEVVWRAERLLQATETKPNPAARR